MIDIAAARAAAETLLDERVRPWVDEPVAIAEQATVEADSVFVFFYNTVAYLETKAITHALAGNGPVIVDRATGTARIADSARPWEEQLAE